MKFNTKNWVITFFGTIGLAVFWEIFSLVDNNRATQPLTHYIVTYIPWQIGMPVIIGIAIWLVQHFSKFYRQRR